MQNLAIVSAETMVVSGETICATHQCTEPVDQWRDISAKNPKGHWRDISAKIYIELWRDKRQARGARFCWKIGDQCTYPGEIISREDQCKVSGEILNGERND